MLTGYLSLGRRSGGDWTNSGHWEERFTVCFWTGSGSSQLLPCFVTYRISWGGLYYRYNRVIVLQTNYIIIIVTCIIDNYGRLQDLICSSNFPWSRERILHNLYTIWERDFKSFVSPDTGPTCLQSYPCREVTHHCNERCLHIDTITYMNSPSWRPCGLRRGCAATG